MSASSLALQPLRSQFLGQGVLQRDAVLLLIRHEAVNPGDVVGALLGGTIGVYPLQHLAP